VNRLVAGVLWLAVGAAKTTALVMLLTAPDMHWPDALAWLLLSPCLSADCDHFSAVGRTDGSAPPRLNTRKSRGDSEPGLHIRSSVTPCSMPAVQRAIRS
jgi:hypothetical protein